MPLLTRKKQFATEQEAVEGTAEVLVAADVQTEVEDLEGRFTPELQERNPLREDLSPAASVVGITQGEISGRAELKPSATPATIVPPVVDVLLALGLQQNTLRTMNLSGAPVGTFVAGEYITGATAGQGFFIQLVGTVMTFVQLVAFVALENITGQVSGATATVNATPAFTDIGFAYRPNSINPPSFTSAVMHDGKKIELIGSRGTGSFEVAGTGQIGYCNFTLSGKAVAPIDQALFAGVNLPNIVPETFKNASVRAGTIELCVNAFNLTLNNTVARRSCTNELTGIKSHRITARRAVISIDPEQELEAAIPFFTQFAAGTLFGFYAQIGSSVGKRVWIVASRAQYIELGQGDRDGLSTHAAQLLCSRGARPGGDDDFIIAFG